MAVFGTHFGSPECLTSSETHKGRILEGLGSACKHFGGDPREAVAVQGDHFEITCEPELYTDVAEALAEAEITVTSKQVTRIPNNTVELDADQARKILKLMEALDDHDDVQNVSANFNLSDEVVAELQAES